MDYLFLGGLLLLGAFTGFAAGLLGIGGGMLLVPFLTMMFTAQKFPIEHVVHMAVATSLTTILFTSVSSVRAHHAHGAVRWDLIKWLGIGGFVGTLLGAQVASMVRTPVLSLIFGVFVSYSALQMLRAKKKAADGGSGLPANAGKFGVGTVIGAISSLVGAGGGFITVPYLSKHGVSMHQSVATSAAMGFPIAAGALAGYVIAGQRFAEMLPPLSLGFIYGPAVLGTAITSVLFAPLGAKTAHGMDVSSLKKVFATLLFCLAGYMLWKAGSTSGLFS